MSVSAVVDHNSQCMQEIVQAVFQYTVQDFDVCYKLGHPKLSGQAQPGWLLPLPIRASLEASLEEFFYAQDVEEVSCTQCRVKTLVQRSSRMMRLPPTLLISLRRPDGVSS